MAKLAFMGVKRWQSDYFQKKILDRDVSYYTENLVIDDNASQIEILACFIFTVLDKKALDRFENLKCIVTMSAGYDHIDTHECKRRGIMVFTAPGYGDNTVAETAFGMLLNLTRKINIANSRASDGVLSFSNLLGTDLKGKTFGVLGTGRIGTAAMNIANGFGMKVIGYDAFPRKELEQKFNFDYVDFKTILSSSDVLSLHMPYLKQTHHVLDDEAFKLMKKGAYLINTARGELIDTSSLISALDSGALAGAGLDVLEGERLLKAGSVLSKEDEKFKQYFDNLRRRENVIICPHISFYSEEAIVRIMDITLKNIYDFIEGRELVNRVI